MTLIQEMSLDQLFYYHSRINNRFSIRLVSVKHDIVIITWQQQQKLKLKSKWY